MSRFTLPGKVLLTSEGLSFMSIILPLLSEFYEGSFSMHLSGTIQGVLHKYIFGSVNFCDIFLGDFHALLHNVAMFL